MPTERETPTPPRRLQSHPARGLVVQVDRECSSRSVSVSLLLWFTRSVVRGRDGRRPARADVGPDRARARQQEVEPPSEADRPHHATAGPGGWPPSAGLQPGLGAPSAGPPPDRRGREGFSATVVGAIIPVFTTR